MKRVDLLLVEQGLATSRTAAQSLLESGRVKLEGSAADVAADPMVLEAYLGGG